MDRVAQNRRRKNRRKLWIRSKTFFDLPFYSSRHFSSSDEVLDDLLFLVRVSTEERGNTFYNDMDHIFNNGFEDTFDDDVYDESIRDVHSGIQGANPGTPLN